MIDLLVKLQCLVTQLIFELVGLQDQLDLTGLGSSLSIVKSNSIGSKYYQVQFNGCDDRLDIVMYKCYKSQLICILQYNRNINHHRIYD